MKLQNDASASAVARIDLSCGDREPAANVSAVYDRMQHEITCKAAAAEIARPRFPSAGLPRIAPLPYVNLGHIVMFDYALFARIVWTTALRLGNCVRDYKKRKATQNSGTLVVSALAFCVVVIALAPFIGATAMVPAVMLACLAAFVVASRRAFEFEDEARRIRSDAICKLLRGETQGLTDHPELDADWIDWGNGRLGGLAAPILVAGDGRPFPGFGPVHLSQLFVASAAESEIMSKLNSTRRALSTSSSTSYCRFAPMRSSNLLMQQAI